MINVAAITVGAGTPVAGAESGISLGTLRNASALNGLHLSDDRLGLLKPVLEQRMPGLQRLRAFELDNSVAPAQGILDK
jgi:hypothetical protein